MRMHATFREACERFEEEFKNRSQTVRSEKWQGVETANRPDLTMREILFTYFAVPLRGIERLDYWQGDIKPNLPFADVHFDERVSGEPNNPGEAWKIWPWGLAADKHRTEGEKFTHTYQERFWPKHAGSAKHPSQDILRLHPLTGIRYEYGDLNDLVSHLRAEPYSRQAYLPIWFPEDGTCKGRKPCTLGYHFIMRGEYLHVSYFIRSCDYIRHFRDDCYLTLRLLLWVLDSLRRLDDRWKDVKPGLFNMSIGSFHMFVNDHIKLFGVQPRA